MPEIITEAFVDEVLQSGHLAKAQRRHLNGESKPSNWDLRKDSCFALVCEEIIDTKHAPEDYDAVLAELLRRGFMLGEINEMRGLAWRTAGWINYEKMSWDWIRLDEADVKAALNWQLKEGRINETRRDEGLAMMERFLAKDPAETKWTPHDKNEGGEDES